MGTEVGSRGTATAICMGLSLGISLRVPQLVKTSLLLGEQAVSRVGDLVHVS